MANKENQWGAVHLGPNDSAEACALLPELARNEIAAIKIGNFLCNQDLATIKTNMEHKNIVWYLPLHLALIFITLVVMPVTYKLAKKILTEFDIPFTSQY